MHICAIRKDVDVENFYVTNYATRDERVFGLQRTNVLLFHHLIMNNTSRVQRYKHIAAAKPARQKKVAEQSGNIIRRMIDIRSKGFFFSSVRSTCATR